MLHKKHTRKLPLLVGSVLLILVLVWLLLQFVLPHLATPFSPDYPQISLAPLLAKSQLSQADYKTLYAQTGLGPLAIDDLRTQGETGIAQILTTQQAFFHPPAHAPCNPLGITTREHRFLDESDRLIYAVPLAPLKEGDILVSLSTHTAGWIHGHAGLVLDPVRPVTLESVVLGSLSDQMNGNHWRSYSTMLVLRPRVAEESTRHAVVQFALEHLDQIPYSLVSGVFGDKFQPVEGPHAAHCGYLPWYAWMSQGVDLDGDGGRIAAPEDLSMSELVDVVQIYGLDPAQYPPSFSD